tara:strand:- start:468 stop:746 length:279 start_codon:yes stop_codon:yes gene_type:complete
LSLAYVVMRQLQYMMNYQSRDSLILRKGDVVTGVEERRVDKQTAKWMKEIRRREMRSGARRVVFFKAHGVIRFAEPGYDLLPVRNKYATVPE